MVLNTVTLSLLRYLVLLSPIFLVSSEKNVAVETFGDDPNHVWFSLNDPVMGGLSTGMFSVKDGIGVFDGEVKNVPKLNAPGFIAMRTGRGGYFPDLRSCKGLSLEMKSESAYNGFRASFGTNFAGTMPYAHGYKTHFDAPVGDFETVDLPFTEFSDNWDPKTGEIVVSCADNNQYCPDDNTLEDFKQLEIMAEGVNGKILLEIKSIHAYGCDDDVSEKAPDSDNGGNNSDGSSFSKGNWKAYKDRDENAVGGSGGYMQPTILENGDIRIESFDNPQHRWYPNNDPVMGGSSTSTVSVQNDAGVFDGEVVDVDFLNAPGFIKMETRGGNFPDVSMCEALKIHLKSANDYSGIRVTFGTHHAPNTEPYVRGYKAHIDNPPVNKFDNVILPFSLFSDDWDPNTGDVQTLCADNPDNCVDDKTLQDFTTFSFMGEGVNGKVHLEVKYIDATDCTHPHVKSSNSDDKTGVIDSAVWAVILVGFVVIGGVAFVIGLRKGKDNVESTAVVTANSDIV